MVDMYRENIVLKIFYFMFSYCDKADYSPIIAFTLLISKLSKYVLITKWAQEVILCIFTKTLNNT